MALSPDKEDREYDKFKLNFNSETSVNTNSSLVDETGTGYGVKQINGKIRTSGWLEWRQ